MAHNRAVSVGRDLVHTVREQQVSFLAAGIAYYMFVSLLPFLLLALVVGSFFGGEAFAARVVAAIGDSLSPTAADLLGDALTSAVGRGGATVLGLATTVWGTLKVLRGLDVAFSRIYGTTDANGFVDSVRDALSALFGIGLALVGLAVITSLGGLFGVEVALGGLALVPVLTVAFLPLYYVFPDHRLTIREAVPGAAFAALGWTVLATGFGVYAAAAGSFQLYGVIGGVLLLVTWFYFAGQILLVGAAFNAVLAGVPDRQLQQEPTRRSGRAMSEDADRASGETPPPDGESATGPRDRGVEDLSDEELAQLREEFESFRDDVQDRTLHRDEVREDLRRYVRRRMRRGHARGWGPYVVLLYGTVMTMAAFYWLSGLWAVLSMLVVWLSTLGLYVMMILTGITFRATGLPGRVIDRVRDWRG
ncbi:YihY/virulence factor BrkB family protein [Haloarcula nitratireducens]|uniref:YihY/virulence factor BrkB family protein n=1 Tax=Haloarcula nitratireducens TaxID=2487749 RepID=A0AAW4PCQ7_9EURY|nr:YihY/virulence factor BrkB family protein [Halomicroarcula nitratireducens]MBX0295665.1 YihY/virulence factor BrkB family protein [Halomicroarcula nitratireducens]